MVGRTLERHQCIGPHQVRVMRHHPEDYLIQFEAPVHRDTLLGYGVLHVDGVPFLTKPWRPDKHAVIQRWMLHVRIVFERLPLDMWSLDGTEEVLATPPLAATPGSVVPPSSRASSVPSKRSARQAVAKSSVPVTQRVTLRLVQALGILGPKEKMIAVVAEEFLKCFDTPLIEEEITGLGALTRLDKETLRVAAGLDGPSSSALGAD
ncbi:uncharacterized protein [Aegilops tauschii subsp. strangulata]|uniref:uncharacterized protein n=1 Tax=Aegilops tauschii subsp. strangulata TaxID=200361 RepID=UPI00098AFFD5|nr:uncharacterized protein LOC109740371 [Aegilops tauschii subsp. strangulata]